MKKDLLEVREEECSSKGGQEVQSWEHVCGVTRSPLLLDQRECSKEVTERSPITRELEDCGEEFILNCVRRSHENVSSKGGM